MGFGNETLPYRTKKVRRSLGYRDQKSSTRKEVSFRDPQHEGKILYYEDKHLVERTPEEVQEALNKTVPSPLNDIVSYGASAACWLVAQQSVMLEDLKETLGAVVGSDLLRVAIYPYLDGGSMDCFEQWASQHFCPKLEYSRAGVSVRCFQK